MEREKLKNFTWEDHLNIIKIDHQSNNKFSFTSNPHPISYMKFLKLDSKMHFLLENLFPHVCETQSIGLLFIFNIGIHYNVDDMESYRSDVINLFNFLNHTVNMYPMNVFGFIWLESSAQHWAPNPETSHNWKNNGYYDHSQQLPCVNILNTSRELDWRNYIVDNILADQANSKLFSQKNVVFQVLPFRSLTEQSYDSHVRGDYTDCTHFCWTPMFYMPVFDFISKIVDLMTRL